MVLRRRVFVSRASLDREVVARLPALVAQMPGWDLVLLPRRSDWQEFAAQEVLRCDAFVYVASDASDGSPWCQWEVQHARMHGIDVLVISAEDLASLPDLLQGTGRATN